jgi:serine/threonine protein kinase/tetratricopeptide (TPR) repeat protein
MNPDRWHEIDRICCAALELEPAKRDAFLTEACAGDGVLREEVEALLGHHKDAAGFMEVPAMEIAARVLAQDPASSLRQDFVGKSLLHFRIEEKLGEGGMGVVYRARDENLQRDVAIKFLSPSILADESARKRFRKEALALSRLNHPNIETVYAFDRQEEIDFLVTEFIPGTTLSDRLGGLGPFAEQEIVGIGMQIAAALEEAHEKGVVHRDLKPANIILTPKHQAKILDFGLAKLHQPGAEAALAESHTESTAIAGTFPYMAPEQLLGEKVDARTDIHALGVVLYELCSGQRPFAGNTLPRLTDAILHRVPEAPQSLGANLSPRLGEIVLKCLEKDPNRRYQSARDLLADMQRLGSSSPVPAFLASLRSKHVRHAMVIAGTVLASLLIGMILWIGHQEPSLAFPPRDWILISDFENLTGEEVFDKSLDTALRVSMEQSSYVNVLPKRRVLEALRRMKKETVPRIDSGVGREIAEREGIRILLVPSISGVAQTYVLSATMEDPKTGATLRSELTRARGKDNVLAELDKLAGLVRRDLGESAGTISRQSKPLARVTTPSLEALKQYSMAIEKHRIGQYGEARTYYDNALAIDPDFAAAKASLGMIHFESAQVLENGGGARFQGIDGPYGKRLLTEAMAQTNNLTDRERFRIEAFYARAAENDLPKAIQYLKAGLVLYPDDSATNNNLGYYSLQLGRLDDAMEAYKEAIRIDPDLMLSYDGLNAVYLYQRGRITDALALIKNQLSRNNGYWQAYSNRGWAFLGMGDLEHARLSFEKAVELNPKSTMDLFRLAHAYRLMKNYPKALEVLERIPKANPSESIDYDLGVVYRLMNSRDQARRHFNLARLKAERDFRAHPKDYAYRIPLAITQARLGRTAELPPPDRQGADIKFDERFLLACLYGVQGKADEAMQQLERAVEQGWNNCVWMKIHPDLQSVVEDPRFQALLQRIMK